MSSISPFDRSNQTDEVRRAREDYENKEAENTKKKNKEIKSLNEKKDQELDKVRDQYNEQLETLRNRHNEQIDERDKRHAEDISKMRDLYADSLRKKSTDEVREREASRSAYEGEIKKEKEISEEQKSEQERGFKKSLSDFDRALGDNQNRSIRVQQQGLQERSDHLNNKHAGEMKSVTEDRDRRVAELRHTLDDTKMTYEDLLVKEARDHRAESDRRTSAFETIYTNQEHNNSEMISSRDAILAESRLSNNRKIGEKIQNETDKMTALREKYADQMDNRTGAMVREARAEVSRAKNDQALESVTGKRMRDLDHEHLVSAYQAREEDLQRQKNEVFDKANEVARDRISTVLGKNEKIMNEANRRNRLDQNTQEMKSREAFAQQENVHKDQILLTNNRADQRVHKVLTATNAVQKNITEQNQENLENVKHNYSDSLQNQREAQLESMKTIYSRMDQKLRDLEAHLLKKHDDAVEYYETKIDETENQHKKDTQRMNQLFETKFNQREKAFKMEEDSLEKKYEQKMAIQDDVHQKDLNRMEKRHQEQVQSIISRATAAQSKKV